MMKKKKQTYPLPHRRLWLRGFQGGKKTKKNKIKQTYDDDDDDVKEQENKKMKQTSILLSEDEEVVDEEIPDFDMDPGEPFEGLLEPDGSYRDGDFHLSAELMKKLTIRWDFRNMTEEQKELLTWRI